MHETIKVTTVSGRIWALKHCLPLLTRKLVGSSLSSPFIMATKTIKSRNVYLLFELTKNQLLITKDNRTSTSSMSLIYHHFRSQHQSVCLCQRKTIYVVLVMKTDFNFIYLHKLFIPQPYCSTMKANSLQLLRAYLGHAWFHYLNQMLNRCFN